MNQTQYDGSRSGKYEVARTANRLGYFKVPREATLLDVATELGITDQEVSQRLRKDIDDLVGDVLADDPSQ